MVKVVFCDAFKVSGVVIPLILNPAPLAPACEMFTLDAPVFVSVTVCDCFVPTATLPKAFVFGLAESCPPVPAATPVPESDRFVAVLDASLVIATVALKVPAALGVNLTPKVVLWPAAIVAGRLGDIREKYLLDIVTKLIVIVAFPVLLAVTLRVSLLPAVTLPKFTLNWPSERVPPGGVVLPALTPWQPLQKARLSRRKNALAAFPRCGELALAAAPSIETWPFSPQVPCRIWSWGMRSPIVWGCGWKGGRFRRYITVRPERTVPKGGEKLGCRSRPPARSAPRLLCQG